MIYLLFALALTGVAGLCFLAWDVKDGMDVVDEELNREVDREGESKMPKTQPVCKARQYSDQMLCECGLAWDVNDPEPPQCGRQRHTSGGNVNADSRRAKVPYYRALYRDRRG